MSLYRFQDTTSYWSKLQIFSTRRVFGACIGRILIRILLYIDLPCAASPANHPPARPRAQRTTP